MAAAESSLAQFFGGTPDKNRVDHPVAQRYAFKSWAMTPAAWQYSLQSAVRRAVLEIKYGLLRFSARRVGVGHEASAYHRGRFRSYRLHRKAR
jgi:hypothetical protein